MRAALIDLPRPGEQALPSIAGKSLAQRQVLFAREVGCDAVIALGGGASGEAIALRHMAERFGMRFHIVSTGHALPGIVGDADSLLVLQPGLLPESRAALDLLRADGERVLVVSAGPGAAAGFERIDLDRAWAGALTVPGHLLTRLTSLPEDTAPQPALLRIALQQRLPEARLADNMLDDGRWSVIASAGAAEARALAWQRTHLGETPPGALARRLAGSVVGGIGRGLMEWRFARAGLLALAALLLAGGVAAGFYEQAAAGFALIALAAAVLEMFLALSRLALAPFGRLRGWPWLRLASDAALLTLGVLAIDSLPQRAAFPPLVLAAGLLLLDRRDLTAWLEPLRDRMVIAAVLALGAVLATPELALMLTGLTILAANLAPKRS